MSYIIPEWQVSRRVRALVTTRSLGNLALHVGDSDQVRANRRRLVREAALPRMPVWMQQVHGIEVWTGAASDDPPVADAAYTTTPDLPLVVMVADCLPVFIASADGDEVGVAHAGWRGLAGGVLAALAGSFTSSELVAWLGPAIGPCHYEVDEVVREQFPGDTGFLPGRDSAHWMMDLYAIARRQLADLGVSSVEGGGFCTWCDDRMYSHRRDGDVNAGRIAAVVWRTSTE